MKAFIKLNGMYVAVDAISGIGNGRVYIGAGLRDEFHTYSENGAALSADEIMSRVNGAIASASTNHGYNMKQGALDADLINQR